MKDTALKAHFGILGSALILAGSGLADATEKRAQIDCLNHLKELGLSVTVEAKDHGDTILHDFLFLTDYGISPSVLICPKDPSRRAPSATVSSPQVTLTHLAATNLSYQLVTTGAKLTSSGNQILVRCPLHQQACYLDDQQIRAESEKSSKPIESDHGLPWTIHELHPTTELRGQPA